MDRFGDNLYNIYGSTEVAYAVDRDAGRPARGAGLGRPAAVRAPWCGSSTTTGAEVPDGETGRIFVGNGLLFEGYTGGGNKEIVDGLMSPATSAASTTTAGCTSRAATTR